MRRPKILDTFCCEGGASMGYTLAGFEVTGVDIDPQPRYPFEFVQADALEYIAEHGREYDAIAASPPCQRYTKAQRLMGNEHLDLIGPTREVLLGAGRPFIIENVEGARRELRSPALLCGEMFGLRTYRHRLFEVHGFELQVPEHPAHVAPLAKMGRPVRDHEYMHVVGNFSNVKLGREIMQMPWASRDGLREAIPPAYTAYIGAELRKALDETKELVA